MRVAIITDTHYGARKGSRYLHDYFELFYENVFFPALEENGVEAVIHMGDAFDSRKSIDYQSLEWAKRVVFNPLKKYDVHMILGIMTHTIKIQMKSTLQNFFCKLIPISKLIVNQQKLMLVDWTFYFYRGLIKEMKNYLLTLSKRLLAGVRWGTWNSKDLELIDKSSWSMVWKANYLRSSNVSSRDTITLDRLTEESHT